jgi:23S rRNA (pseudouridine1915-N3)-methyltransferase
VRIALIAVGDKPPSWVRDGYADYAKRLPHPHAPALVEIPPGARSATRDPARAIAEEGARVMAALPKNAWVVALDERGAPWRTIDLAKQTESWERSGRDVALLIGGADGHAPDVVARADAKWSLSPLTLPHMLVRLLVIEQLYRAWSIRKGHPYHRA